MPAPAPLSVDVPASDGVLLAATLFAPEGEPDAAVVIAPAMGVPQDYYAALAGWLAARGLLAATFDYRGTGRSLRGPMRRVETDLVTWGRRDCAAVLEAVAARAPGLPLHWVGHSLGGQLLPFIENLSRVDRAVMVAAGSGYWRQNSWPLRLKVPLLWFAAVPLALPLFGYFPGRRLGMVGDLPRGAMAQWRRWCLDPDYAAGAEGPATRAAFAAVRTPILALSFEDDEMMSARSVEALLGLFASAPVVHRRFGAREAGVARIGHFGFFRPALAEPIWAQHLLPALR